MLDPHSEYSLQNVIPTDDTKKYYRFVLRNDALEEILASPSSISITCNAINVPTILHTPLNDYAISFSNSPSHYDFYKKEGQTLQKLFSTNDMLQIKSKIDQKLVVVETGKEEVDVEEIKKQLCHILAVGPKSIMELESLLKIEQRAFIDCLNEVIYTYIFYFFKKKKNRLLKLNSTRIIIN
jgi:hypothetical protein